MQTQNPAALTTCTNNSDRYLVSLTLNSSQEEKLTNIGEFSASSSIMASLSSSPPSSSLIGDYIGVESCLDLKKNDDIFTSSSEVAKSQDFSQRRSKRDQNRAVKEFPPPIPSLARTGNLACHMPWVMRRYYTDDGRLIIREERVKHHEYFQAHRCNGRLTLKLVPLDNEVYPPCPRGFADDLDENENEFEYCEEVEKELDDCHIEEEEEEEEQEEDEEVEKELDDCHIEEEEEEEEQEEEEEDGTDNCGNEEEVKNELENCSSEEENGDNKDTVIEDQCKDIQVNENGREYACDVGINYFQSCNGTTVKDFLYEDQRVLSVESGSSGIGGNLSAFKCLNIYNSTVRPGSNCIFMVPVPALRSVHG